MLITNPVRRDDRGRIVGDNGLPIAGLCSVAEAAAVTGLGLSTIYKMIKDGTLPSLQFGRARRVPWSAIQGLISCDSPSDSPDVTR